MIARLYHRLMKTFKAEKPEDFKTVVEFILNKESAPRSSTVVALSGDLGAGKTTLVQQLASYLQVTELVVSPTFGIMKAYELIDNPNYDQLVHIDAYRIEDMSEAGPLRLKEIFDTPRTLICVEWSEKISEILPQNHTAVSIDITAGEERTVTVQ
tara:strand:- start:8590 stop:9054 length:465 start_codon:yes stop_codon:yes gene_type:complete